jgi:hypothetical protein
MCLAKLEIKSTPYLTQLALDKGGCEMKGPNTAQPFSSTNCNPTPGGNNILLLGVVSVVLPLALRTSSALCQGVPLEEA